MVPKGSHLSDETRKKQSESVRLFFASAEGDQLKCKLRRTQSGQGNPFFGKKHTEESKAKMSRNRSGLSPSEEVIAKLRIANGGKNNGFYGKKHSEETKAKLRELAKGRQLSEETKQKMRDAQQGVKNHNYGMQMDEETKRRISEAKKGCKPTTLGRHHTEGAKEKLRQIHTGMTASEETKKKMSLKHVGNKSALGHRDTAEVKRIKSQATKEHWQNPTYRDSVVRNSRLAANIRPNKLESWVLNVLNEIAPNEWKYVGNGEVVICGRNPDIMNVNGKKSLILVHGIFWHLWKFQKDNPELTREQVEREDVAFYRTYGWDSLIVWEDELTEPERVKEKIRQFCEVGHGHTHLCKA